MSHASIYRGLYKCFRRTNSLGSVYKQHVRAATTYHPLNTPQQAAVIQHSPYRPVDIPEDTPFVDYMQDSLSKYAEKIAYVDGISGKQWSFNDVQRSVSRVGSALTRLGMKKGDVATILSPNCPEFSLMFLGLAAIGGVTSAVNPMYTADELLIALDLAESKMLVTVPELLSVAQSAVVRSKTCKDIIVFGEAEGCIPFSSLLEDDGLAFPSDVKINPKEDLLGLPFSSGTTGVPKGVMLTHYNVISNLEQLRYDDTLGYQPDDVFIAALPFFHIYGKVLIMFGGLLAGAKNVTLPKFEPNLYLTMAQNHKATWLHIVPPLALFLVKHPMVDKFQFPSLKNIICGAAPLGGDIADAMIARMGNVCFRQGFGLTEASPVTHVNPVEGSIGKQVAGSIGYVLPNMLCKVVDIDTGETLGVEKEGELCVKGPNVMKGYLKNPEATAHCIQDGWLRTGDVAKIDKDGHCYVVDRLKELIKHKGYQVAPAEIENLLLAHDSIIDCAVIGIPDEKAGEVPRAYVVHKAHQAISHEDIHMYLKDKLAPYKQLTGGIEFVEEIPKSASGKVLRRNLKESYTRKHQQ